MSQVQPGPDQQLPEAARNEFEEIVAEPEQPASFPISGRVAPTDPRYPSLVRGFNQRWVGHPHYVEVCQNTDHLLQAVQKALDEGRRPTVRSGGHCYEDFVCDNPGGVILDISQLNKVSYESDTGYYCVEAGATLWNVYNHLFKEYGVTVPGGSCYSVGAGGHITGGGYGLLSRKYGLTIDYLEAVEVLVVDGTRKAHYVTARRDALDQAEKDLLWGHLGGGGGNFGIVTKFYFRQLPPAPREAYLLNLAWDWEGLKFDHFSQLVNAYGQFLEANSDPSSPFAGLFTLLHLTYNSSNNQQIVLTAQYVGEETSNILGNFSQAMQSSISQLKPVAQRAPVGYHQMVSQDTSIQKWPWLLATQTLNGSGNPRRGKYKSAYMLKSFPQAQIETMWQALSNEQGGFTNPQALLQIDSYGCQVNTVAPDATASPQRSSVMKLQYQTYWNNPAEDAANLDWIRSFYTDMYGEKGPVPDGTVMDGCYVNYPDVDLVDWPLLYYKDNYPRLQRVKAQWDPLDIFHHTQSIELPPPTVLKDRDKAAQS